MTVMPSVTGHRGQILVVAGLLSVYLGLVLTSSAAASFGKDAFYPTQPTETAITAGDVDGDGDIDLVSGGDHDNGTILRSNGDGSFAPASTFSHDGQINSIAIGEFTGDNSADLAVGNNASLQIFKGDGSGTFGPDPEPGSPGAYASAKSFAATDLNGDGITDFVTVSVQVEVWMGNGDGTFDPPTGFAANGAPDSVAVGDLNGDSKPDLAVANGDSHDVSILLGHGDGSFAPAVNHPLDDDLEIPYFSFSPDMSIVVGDLNRDGAGDVVVSDTYAQGVSVLLGDGTGSLGRFTQVSGVSNPTSIAVADFNSDRYLDIVASQYSDGTMKFLGGTGTGKFRLVSTLPAGGSVFAITSAQLNQDAVPDLAAANYNEGGVSVLLNKGPAARFGPIDVRAPATVRRNRVLTYRVAIPGAGDSTLRRVRLKVTARGIRTRVLSLGSVPPGTVKRVKVKVRPTSKGYLRARFKATSANAPARSARELVWVNG